MVGSVNPHFDKDESFIYKELLQEENCADLFGSHIRLLADLLLISWAMMFRLWLLWRMFDAFWLICECLMVLKSVIILIWVCPWVYWFSFHHGILELYVENLIWNLKQAVLILRYRRSREILQCPKYSESKGWKKKKRKDKQIKNKFIQLLVRGSHIWLIAFHNLHWQYVTLDLSRICLTGSYSSSVTSDIFVDYRADALILTHVSVDKFFFG